MIQSILNTTNILADSDKIGGKTVFAQEDKSSIGQK